ncbi:MAG: hypothetical protein EON92_12590 [Burkholderiales bacterium]|nr:MAG: hypothetical protein EON92_12590 [Burkholderiales bacterium]
MKIICAAVFAVTVGGLEQANGTSRRQQSEAPQSQPARMPDAVATPHIYPQVQDLGCDQGQENRQSDLCAQWKAADAGKSSARAAWSFGFIGTIIGVATFLAAMSAARWAKRAAEHAGHSANIASDALIADTRAWLAIKAVSPHAVGDPPDESGKNIASRITLWIHNYGRGPALDCEVRVGWKRRGEVWESVEYAPYCRTARFDTLMPNEGMEDILVRLDDPIAEVFMDGMLMLWVEVTYRIVGADGLKRTTQQLSVGGLSGKGIMPIGIGYLARGHGLAAVPIKTSMT